MAKASVTKRPNRLRSRSELEAGRRYVVPEQAKSEAAASRGNGRLALGENRLVRLVLADARAVALCLERCAKHVPAALAKDAKAAEQKVTRHIAALDALAVTPRKPGSGAPCKSFRIERPDGTVEFAVGMAGVAAAVGRKESYVKNRMSVLGGVWEMPCAHPDTGNPALTIVRRLGTEHA